MRWDAACVMAVMFVGTGGAWAQQVTPQGGASLRYPAAFFAEQRPKTALDMINWLSGFSFLAGDATIRGFTGAAGNVVIDGERPADKDFTLSQILQRIPASQVDYVEVIRGNAPGIDMLGQSLVANVVRKKVVTTNATLSVSEAYFLNGPHAPSLTLEGSRRDNQGRVLSGAVSLSRYVEASSGTGPQVRRDSAGGLLGERDVNLSAGGWTAFAFGIYETPALGGQLRLNANMSWTDYNSREIDQIHFPTPSTSVIREKLGGPLSGQLRGQVGANFKRDIDEDLTSESVFLLRLRDQDYTSRLFGAGFTQVFFASDSRGELVGRTLLRRNSGDVTAEVGLEGAYNWLETGNNFQFNAIPIPLPNAQASVSETRGEASAKLTWKTSGTLQLEAGIRLEMSQIESQADTPRQTSLFYPKPRLALTWTPSDRHQVRLRLEREVGQLDFNNYVASSSFDTGSIRVGNTAIVPQQAWLGEIAYEYRFWTAGVIGLTYRHSLIADAIDRVPVRDPVSGTASFDAPGNIGAGLQDALVAALTLPLDRLGLNRAQIKAAGTFQWSRVTDPTTREKRSITDLNPIEYAINFRQDLPQWQAAWGASLVTPCATTATAKGCARSQFRFNEVDVYRAGAILGLFVEYQPRQETSLRLEANNILSLSYERDVNIYGGPRDAFGLSYADSRWLRSSPSFKISLRETL